MIITINNIEINKYELLHLINNGKKLSAIKLIKDKTKLSLKDCKDIVDNLEVNSNYYEGDTVLKTEVSSSKVHNRTVQRKKGNHIISSNSSNAKNYIIVFLLIGIAILLYMYNMK